MAAVALQMNVLMFMFAGSDTSRESHKVLLGILPDLPPAIRDKVRSLLVRHACRSLLLERYIKEHQFLERINELLWSIGA